MGDFFKRIKRTDLIGMIFAFVIFAFIIFFFVMVLGAMVAEFHVGFWYFILAIIIITATIDLNIKDECKDKCLHARIKLNDTMVRSWKESKFLNWPIGIMTFFTLLSLTVIGLELSGACIPELLGQDPREIAVWNHPNCG